MTKQIIAIVLFVLAGAVFFGYTKPTYDQVRTHQVKVSQLDQLLEQRKSFDAKKAQLISMLNAFPPDNLLRLKRMLPDHVDNVRLILDLNSLASRSGVVLSNFDTSATAVPNEGDKLSLTSQGPVESLDLSVSATGNYSSFKSFLKGAELSLRPLDLIDLTIDDSNTGVYSYTMTFRIYWLR
jgi:Tfp pilus assembly protein PilO